MATPHDRLFKELLTTFFPDFIKLFLPDLAAKLVSTELIEVNKELFGEENEAHAQEADIVIRAQLTDQDAMFLIHIEHQSNRDYNMGERMYEYGARLFLKYHLDVYPVLVCSYDTPLDAEPHLYVMNVAGKDVIKLDYAIVQLNRLSWKNYVKTPNPVASALMSKMQVAESDKVKVKLACFKMLAGLKLKPDQQRLVARFVNTYVRLDDKGVQEFETELSKEVGTRGRKKIMELLTDAEERGQKRGIRLGETDFLLDLLNYKVGPLSDEVQERIRALDEQQKRALGRAAFDFTGQQDLVNWLAQV